MRFYSAFWNVSCSLVLRQAINDGISFFYGRKTTFNFDIAYIDAHSKGIRILLPEKEQLRKSC